MKKRLSNLQLIEKISKIAKLIYSFSNILNIFSKYQIPKEFSIFERKNSSGLNISSYFMLLTSYSAKLLSFSLFFFKICHDEKKYEKNSLKIN